jgi:hypothetical protein
MPTGAVVAGVVALSTPPPLRPEERDQGQYDPPCGHDAVHHRPGGVTRHRLADRQGDPEHGKGRVGPTPPGREASEHGADRTTPCRTSIRSAAPGSTHSSGRRFVLHLEGDAVLVPALSGSPAGVSTSLEGSPGCSGRLHSPLGHWRSLRRVRLSSHDTGHLGTPIPMLGCGPGSPSPPEDLSMSLLNRGLSRTAIVGLTVALAPVAASSAA